MLMIPRGLFHIRFRRFYCWCTRLLNKKCHNFFTKRFWPVMISRLESWSFNFKHSPWRWKHHLHVAELRWWRKEKLQIKMEKWVFLKVIHLISKVRVSFFFLRWVIWEFLGPLRHTVPTKNMYRHKCNSRTSVEQHVHENGLLCAILWCAMCSQVLAKGVFPPKRISFLV